MTAAGTARSKQASLMKRFWHARYIYLLLVPGIAYFVLFAYKPMYGLLMAFEKFNVRKGILGSPFVGLANFRRLFITSAAVTSIFNTLEISLTRMAIEFPFPILLAILLNELRVARLKRVYQTIFTFPNFLSWVVVGTLFKQLLSNDGLLNNILITFGSSRMGFLSTPSIFRPLLYFTSIWKSAGWSAIIYMAAISGINPELYEAAIVDGATRTQRIWHVTLPGLLPTIIVMFILAIGGLMNGGFDQIFNLYNPVVAPVANTIDVYVYNITFGAVPDYGFSTAVGLFKSVINVALLLGANWGAKAINGNGLFQ